MFQRVPQPPVNRALRAGEQPDFWPGFIVGLLGVLLVVLGARHVTGVETVDGGAARETQLVKAFSFGGLKFPEPAAAAEPPKPTDDPVATAEALDRWARAQATAAPQAWQVRVDTGAKTPCPT
jgi:hypothetical protein